MDAVGDFVIVKPEEGKGVIITPDTVTPDYSYCRIVAVGNGKLVEHLKVGDRLMITSGRDFEIDKQVYLRCHANELMVILGDGEVFTDTAKSMDTSEKVLEK